MGLWEHLSELFENANRSFDQLKANFDNGNSLPSPSPTSASPPASFSGPSSTPKSNANIRKFEYPQIRRDDSSNETIFGTLVEDAYRYLEDANSAETKRFVDAQNALSEPFIRECPHRSTIIAKLQGLYEYPRYGCPFRRGPNYFMFINSGLQNQPVMYVMRGELDASKAEIFFDPNALSSDGTVSLSTYANEFSRDGKWFAYGLNESGSDWITVRIRNVNTGNDLPETLRKLKFATISWTHDNEGFFYAAYCGAANEVDGTETQECVNQKLLYHRLGTPQSADILVYERSDHPLARFTTDISDCGRYLHVFTNVSCQYNLWHYHRFDDPAKPQIVGRLALRPIVDQFDADYHYVTNDDAKHYIRTNFGAPNFRVMIVDLNEDIDRANWRDLIAEHSRNVLQHIRPIRADLLVAVYIEDVTSRLSLHDLRDGARLHSFDSLLPEMGTIASIRAQRMYDEFFFNFTSFLVPGMVFRVRISPTSSSSSSSSSPVQCSAKFFCESNPINFDRSRFVSKQVFYPSRDGTRIPMFIVHRRDLRLGTGDRPCMLYAYGGFGTSVMPAFALQRVILMQHLDGIFAVANIRGGGEYGETWHRDGMIERKQTCFDDFIAAAEYLIAQKYTCANRITIQGASNGGLLIGAVTNQRPDLFGACIGHVGVMDLIRFHKFTIGHAWISEYGNPEVESHFRNLIRLSPLHNVPDAQAVDRFPAVLLLTADHDDRVVPLHSFKLIAQLQHKLGDKFGATTPIMIRVDTKSGHGAGKPTDKIIEEIADIYCFIINALSLEFKP